jgi:hypothetical protein
VEERAGERSLFSAGGFMERVRSRESVQKISLKHLTRWQTSELLAYLSVNSLIVAEAGAG